MHSWIVVDGGEGFFQLRLINVFRHDDVFHTDVHIGHAFHGTAFVRKIVRTLANTHDGQTWIDALGAQIFGERGELCFHFGDDFFAEHLLSHWQNLLI